MDNYRPIAILPVFDKIMEAFIEDRLKNTLINNNIINNIQHEFQTGKSTNTLVIKFTNFINNKLNIRNHVLALFIDFSKVFDTIKHGISICKLKKKMNK